VGEKMDFYPIVINFSNNKDDIKKHLPAMFKLISTNMSAIAPTGNSLDEDCCIWQKAMYDELKKPNKKWLLAFNKGMLCGYMLYRIDTNLKIAYMDEIQLDARYQGDGVTFAKLFGCFLFSKEIECIETLYSYANKNNIKSQAILKCLGLSTIENFNNGFRFIGKKVDATSWFEKKYGSNFIIDNK
jgi:hypothetical protein